VVECDGFEIRYTGNGIGGSNPPLSALILEACCKSSVYSRLSDFGKIPVKQYLLLTSYKAITDRKKRHTSFRLAMLSKDHLMDIVIFFIMMIALLVISLYLYEFLFWVIKSLWQLVF
jgi:hypothetical protein